MKVLRIILFTIIAAGIYSHAYSDSPLTSTRFHTAYSDISAVRKASEQGVLTKRTSRFLLSPKTPVAHKAALINALSWSIDGKNNAELFSKELMKKYKFSSIDFSQLNGNELFCLTYLTAMDDYFHPERAFPLIEKTLQYYQKQDEPPPLSVRLVFALIKAQKAMGADWCTVWKLTDDALSMPGTERDLREQAVKAIIDYMGLYRNYCK